MWEEINNDQVRDVLLVADVDVSLEAIQRWTPTQRVAAMNWAQAIYLLASDNVLNMHCRAHDEDAEYDPPFKCICAPPKPEFLEQYPRPKFEDQFPLLKRAG